MTKQNSAQARVILSKFFDGKYSTILTELLQNARRAKATKIAVNVVNDSGIITTTIEDNGTGIEDFNDLLTIGSNWDSETIASETPAGCGFAATADVPEVLVESGNRSVKLTPNTWTHGNPLDVQTHDEVLVDGTRVTLKGVVEDSDSLSFNHHVRHVVVSQAQFTRDYSALCQYRQFFMNSLVLFLAAMPDSVEMSLNGTVVPPISFDDYEEKVERKWQGLKITVVSADNLQALDNISGYHFGRVSDYRNIAINFKGQLVESYKREIKLADRQSDLVGAYRVIVDIEQPTPGIELKLPDRTQLRDRPELEEFHRQINLSVAEFYNTFKGEHEWSYPTVAALRELGFKDIPEGLPDCRLIQIYDTVSDYEGTEASLRSQSRDLDFSTPAAKAETMRMLNAEPLLEDRLDATLVMLGDDSDNLKATLSPLSTAEAGSDALPLFFDHAHNSYLYNNYSWFPKYALNFVTFKVTLPDDTEVEVLANDDDSISDMRVFAEGEEASEEILARIDNIFVGSYPFSAHKHAKKITQCLWVSNTKIADGLKVLEYDVDIAVQDVEVTTYSIASLHPDDWITVEEGLYCAEDILRLTHLPQNDYDGSITEDDLTEFVNQMQAQIADRSPNAVLEHESKMFDASALTDRVNTFAHALKAAKVTSVCRGYNWRVESYETKDGVTRTLTDHEEDQRAARKAKYDNNTNA